MKQQQFLYGYIFGAVCPKTGKTAALVLPELNSKTMQLHLDLISSEIEDGKHAIIICDQASWHVTQKLKWPKNLSCLSLPPYSPELNPMEQVWQYLRQHDLSNRCFDGYNAILDACCNAWNNFTRDISKVIRLCSRKWANVE